MTQNIPICRLCNTKQALKSHVIPKFIIRWLNKTGTGRLRHLANPDRPTQDGIVRNLLCGSCEIKFSAAETYFANRIFFPVADNNISVLEYDSRLTYFTISVLWRFMICYFFDEVQNPKWQQKLTEIEKEWSDFLLLDKPLNNFGELHLITGVDIMDNSGDSELKKRKQDFIRYMARSIDAGAPENDEIFLLYLKIPRFLFIVPIYGLDTSGFLNSQVFTNGIFDAESVVINSSDIGSYFLDRMIDINRAKDGINEKQKSKSRDIYINNLDEISQKDLGKINAYLERKQDESYEI
nr:hypothetical protein [Flavobacterium sp. ASV13]